MTPKAAEYADLASRMASSLVLEGVDAFVFAEHHAFRAKCMSLDNRDPTTDDWSALEADAVELRAKAKRPQP